MGGLFDLAWDLFCVEDEIYFRKSQKEDILYLIKLQIRNPNGRFGGRVGVLPAADGGTDVQSEELSPEEKQAYNDFSKNRAVLNRGLYGKGGQLPDATKKFINEQVGLLDRVTTKIKATKTAIDTMRVFKVPNQKDLNDFGVDATFTDASFLTGAKDGTTLSDTVNDKLAMDGVEVRLSVPAGFKLDTRKDGSRFGKRGVAFSITEALDKERKLIKASVYRSSVTPYTPPSKSLVLSKSQSEDYEDWPDYCLNIRDLTKIDKKDIHFFENGVLLNKYIDRLNTIDSRLQFLYREQDRLKSVGNSLLGGIKYG